MLRLSSPDGGIEPRLTAPRDKPEVAPASAGDSRLHGQENHTLKPAPPGPFAGSPSGYLQVIVYKICAQISRRAFLVTKSDRERLPAVLSPDRRTQEAKDQ